MLVQRPGAPADPAPGPLTPPHGLLYCGPAGHMPRSPGRSRSAFLYQDILRDLRRDLQALTPGAPVPSEPALRKRYGVSRTTVRHALGVLREEGTIHVVRGQGTFVSDRKLDVQPSSGPAGFSALARRHGLVPSSRLLRFERTGADAPTARDLGLEVGEPVFRIDRIRYADGQAAAVERTFVPVAVCPRLFRHNLATGSLYRILAAQGLTLARSAGAVEARSAGRTLGRLFGGASTDPVLVVHRTVFDANDVAVEVTTATYRADRYVIGFRTGACP